MFNNATMKVRCGVRKGDSIAVSAFVVILVEFDKSETSRLV